MLFFVIYSVIAYLIGSLMPGYWIGLIFFKKNIRTKGSGNIGTTNAFRTLGVIPGTITMLLDIIKGSIAVWIPLYFGPAYIKNYVLYIGLFAVLGHVYSIFLKFHGGKAVATSAGVVLAYNFNFFLIILLVLFIALLITSMMSLSSILTFIIGTLIAIFYYRNTQLIVFSIISSIVAIYAHRTNIKRIIKGTESLVPFGLNYWFNRK